jgi:fermentation-respiration switch protein FrsA (DUF1100 family)
MLKLGIVAIVAAGIVFLFLASIYVLQRAVMFPAPPSRGESSEGAELVSFAGPDGRYRALLLAPAGAAPEPAPLVIFAHGNGELADEWIDAFGPLRSWGWAVLLLEYPGYGGSPGSPSEPSIRAAGLALFDWAAGNARFDRTRIVAYGRSIGGAAAVQIAAARPVAALVLESAFTSARPLAARYRVPGWLVRDPFDNLKGLAGYRGPLLVVHGSEDSLISVSEGRALAAAVPGAQFHALPCGHNDCPRPWGILREFLAAHRLVADETR